MQTLYNWRKPPHGKTMGIEIEMVSMKEWDGYMGFFYATYDGSIVARRYSGERANEFVSQPLSPEWLKREIDKLFKKMIDPDHNPSCGVHIHVSKAWCTPKKAQAIKKFVKELDVDEFADLFGRDPNGYCIQDTYDSDRYAAVNVTNEKTIEFRMFRSGDAAWCKYCVDCATYMVENAYRLNKDAFFAFKDLKAKEYGFE